MTTTFSDVASDAICNKLDMTLMGDMEVPEGVDSDGYHASYAYAVTDIPANDMQMTCFGFDDDTVGYFCVGALSQEFADNEYSGHGVGYWNLSAAQVAEREERLGGAEGSESAGD